MENFIGVEVVKFLDQRYRLIIPEEIVRTKQVGGYVYLVNKKVAGRSIARVYYNKPKIKCFIEAKVNETKKGIHRVTVVKSIRQNSFSFFYGKSVMVVDAGDFLEILPWPSH